jgi:hypothetical protein
MSSARDFTAPINASRFEGIATMPALRSSACRMWTRSSSGSTSVRAFMNATDIDRMCPSLTRVRTTCPSGVPAKLPRNMSVPSSA